MFVFVFDVSVVFCCEIPATAGSNFYTRVVAIGKPQLTDVDRYRLWSCVVFWFWFLLVTCTVWCLVFGVVGWQPEKDRFVTMRTKQGRSIQKVD